MPRSAVRNAADSHALEHPPPITPWIGRVSWSSSWMAVTPVIALHPESAQMYSSRRPCMSNGSALMSAMASVAAPAMCFEVGVPVIGSINPTLTTVSPAVVRRSGTAPRAPEGLSAGTSGGPFSGLVRKSHFASSRRSSLIWCCNPVIIDWHSLEHTGEDCTEHRAAATRHTRSNVALSILTILTSS